MTLLLQQYLFMSRIYMKAEGELQSSEISKISILCKFYDIIVL